MGGDGSGDNSRGRWGKGRRGITCLWGELTHGCDRDVPPLILQALQLVQLLHQFQRVAHASLSDEWWKGRWKGWGFGGGLSLWIKAIFEYSLSVAGFSLADWPSSYVRDWWVLLFFWRTSDSTLKFSSSHLTHSREFQASIIYRLYTYQAFELKSNAFVYVFQRSKIQKETFLKNNGTFLDQHW